MPSPRERAAAPAPSFAALVPAALVEAGDHVARTCNACRYCEGFCPVFPALERHRRFSARELVYLANLCHDCGACLDACQYAPPHAFGIDVPRTLAALRRASYRAYAWPTLPSGLFERSTLLLVVAGLVLPLGFPVGLLRSRGAGVVLTRQTGEGAFYQILPHPAMIAVFGTCALYGVVALLVGLARCWRDLSDLPGISPSWRALGRALAETLTLRHLGEADEGGCVEAPEATVWRRRWHQCTFYGLGLCFLATTVAAVQHNLLGWLAPYPLLSAPVVLGSVGGVGLLAGPVGLLWLKRRRAADRRDDVQAAMDRAFLLTLFETGLTGFLVLIFRDTMAMGVLLGVHLGAVAGLFLSAPYGKFVHGLYRFSALVRYAMDASEDAARQKG